MVGSGEDPVEIDPMVGERGMLRPEENQREQEQEGLLEVGQRAEGMVVRCQHHAQQMAQEHLPFLPDR